MVLGLENIGIPKRGSVHATAWALASVFPVFQTQGRLVEAHVFFWLCLKSPFMIRLINLYFTSKRTLLKQLAEKEKIIRYNAWFVRTWAHDQSTATNAINAAVQFIEQEGGITTEHLDLLKVGIQLLRDGAFNLVDYLKAEPSAKKEFIDLVEILETIIQLYSALAKFHNVKLVLQFDGSAPMYFHSDSLMVQRILGNLVSNAIKFSPPNERVILRAYGENGNIFFQVEDHGQGIPINKQSEIFRPYVKLNEEKPGTGLGLAICRRFARLLGGDITVNSVLDKGSIFSVRIKAINA